MIDIHRRFARGDIGIRDAGISPGIKDLYQDDSGPTMKCSSYAALYFYNLNLVAALFIRPARQFTPDKQGSSNLLKSVHSPKNEDKRCCNIIQRHKKELAALGCRLAAVTGMRLQKWTTDFFWTANKQSVDAITIRYHAGAN